MDTQINYYNTKSAYLSSLKKEYYELAKRFHNRFHSWIIRLFRDDSITLNIWSKGWEHYIDTVCIRIDMDGGGDSIKICEEDNYRLFYTNQRSDKDNQCVWYNCYPTNSNDPIGNYETLIRLLRDKLNEYGEFLYTYNEKYNR